MYDDLKIPLFEICISSLIDFVTAKFTRLRIVPRIVVPDDECFLVRSSKKDGLKQLLEDLIRAAET